MTDNTEYFEHQKRVAEMNVSVAMALGWELVSHVLTVSPEQHYREVQASRGMFGQSDVPVLSIGFHTQVYWFPPERVQEAKANPSMIGYKLDHDWWADNLNDAWQLVQRASEIATVDNLSAWAKLSAKDAAFAICVAFISRHHNDKT